MESAFGVDHGEFAKTANKSLNVFLGAGGTKARSLRKVNLPKQADPRMEQARGMAADPITRPNSPGRAASKARQANLMKPQNKLRVGDKTGKWWDTDLRATQGAKAPRQRFRGNTRPLDPPA